MDTDIDIAGAAGAIGNPTRAAFLIALASVEGLPAGELARRARVSPQTASEHLAKLVDFGLVRAERSGRHRYFHLASPAVGAAIEALSVIAPAAPVQSLREAERVRALRAARTCYDHLAGTLGVGLACALEEQNWIVGADDDFALTDTGERALVEFGVDVVSLRARRRPLTRACLDWSERRYHLAGSVGAALTSRLFELQYIRRLPGGGRAVRLTDSGRRGLLETLGLDA